MGRLRQPWNVIDVSEHNGRIDWEQVKADGVQGAIIRCGFGTDGVDKTYKYNVSECIRLDIPFGFYHYSYVGWELDKIKDANKRLALIKEQGRDEAVHFWELIAPYELNISLPVFIDIEDKCSLVCSARELHFAIKEHYNFLSSRNLNVGIYASHSQLEGKLNWYDKSNPNEDCSVLGYMLLWNANWGRNDATQKHEDCPQLKISAIEGQTIKPDMWQYSSNGSTKGINTRVDVNYMYTDFITENEDTGFNGAWCKGIDMKPNERGRLAIHGSNFITEMMGMPNPFWIYRNEDGAIHRGIKNVGADSFYYLESIGVQCDGERFVDGNRYFFEYGSGKMLKSRWLRTKDSMGNIIEKFYLPNGKMASFNKFKINGVDYIFTPVGTTVPEDQAPFIGYGEEFGDANIICTEDIYDITVPQPEPEPEVPEPPVEPEKPIEPEEPVEPEKPTDPDKPVDPPVTPEEPEQPVTPPDEPSAPEEPEMDDKGIVALLRALIDMIVALLRKLFKN